VGTSGSSSGPGSGVSFDPPWLDDIDTPQVGDGQTQDDESPAAQDPEDPQAEQGQSELPPDAHDSPDDVAPPRRFFGARLALREFAKTGSEDAFRRAVGHYSRTGMGGSRRAASRMRTSTRSGANAISLLRAARDKTDPAINEWVGSLVARNAGAQEIADEIVRYAMPQGGSLDEASCRRSMALALQDLLAGDAGIDLLNLEESSIWSLIESFLGYEAFSRLTLDIGQVFEAADLSPREQVTRMKEMHDYLRAELSWQVAALRKDTSNAAPAQLQPLLQRALADTFAVYEGWI